MRAQQPRGRRFMDVQGEFTVIDAFDKLFRQWFDGPSWDGWRAILKAAYCLPMSPAEIEFFRSVAERDPPTKRPKELWVIAGRRSGKDSVASAIATHAAAFFRAGLDRLRPGERATVACLACDRDQGRIILNYIKSYFDNIPPLRDMVRRQTADGLELRNDVSIEISTNSYKSVRGRAFLLTILDECAYYSDENSARPAEEVYAALKPGLSTLPGSMLIGISSPYRKSGLLFSKYRKHFGQNDDDVLVIQAATSQLNSTIDPAIIAKALEDDPAAARAEWLGEFRDDISGFVDAEIVQACIVDGVRERPRSPHRHFGFCDPSGGSADSMTLCVSHREGDKVIIDAIRERRPPFSPADVCFEFAATLKSYGISDIQSDRYAGGWPVEAFGAHGIRVEQSAKPKSDLYLDLLPLLNSRRIELLDVPRLLAQLIGLERRTARSGRDSIDHAPGAHDDIANCVAGAAALAIANVGVHVSPELLARAMAMPVRPGCEHWAWDWRKRAAMAQLIPREKQCYPASVLPAEKFIMNEGD
jgi:hypothetical protein